jgi:DNA-binding NtrC family response regulator
MDCSHGLVGQSPQIRQIRCLIQKVSQGNSPVLLLGESGTGKEVVARAIYNANPAGAFVPIDCGSLVGPLMESELFGHTRGAFTGAMDAKKGLIDMADGGTAFFDEIGDLPLEMQVKLLRLLQEQEFRPVGALKQHKVQVRVIAATHRNLPREIERGNFRLDLYYRLNVVKITLPSLRERKEDIPLLVEFFLQRLGKNHTLTQEVLDSMTAYDWPGNVRELKNAIERMVALNSGPLLHLADMPTTLQNHRDAERAGQLFVSVAAFKETVPPTTAAPHAVLRLEETEKRAILAALAHTKGDRSTAATLLGIGRTTLYRKLKEYGIDQ